MKSPIEQLDKLVRYLINNYGNAVKVDDTSNEDAVDEAIKILEQQRHLTSRSSRAVYACICKEPTISEKSYCTKCGRDMYPPPA